MTTKTSKKNGNRSTLVGWYYRLCPVFTLGLGCLLSSGCDKQPDSSGADQTSDKAQEKVAQPRTYHLDHALPKLPVVKLWLGPAEIKAEITRTITETSTGMMFRTEMGDDEGMLFFLGAPRKASFYMKNTTLPLTCAYIDSQGEILEIHNLEPLVETPVESTSTDILFVLETPRDWFDKNNVRPGMIVRSEIGPLLQIYDGNGSGF